ncbi:MAG: PL29 family lyase N-terminal domain-containing protein [Anaeroplasmataceae bacterium]
MLKKDMKKKKGLIGLLIGVVCALCIACTFLFKSRDVNAAEKPTFVESNGTVITNQEQFDSLLSLEGGLNGSYKITTNINVTNSLELLSNVSFFADSPVTITLSNSSYIYFGNVTLNVCDNVTITSSDESSEYNYLVCINNSGTLNLWGGTISSGRNITIKNNGNFNLYEGTVSNTSLAEEETPTESKGLCVLNSGELVLAGGTIGNIASKSDIDASGYEGTINFLPILSSSIPCIKNTTIEKVNLLDEKYTKKQNEEDVIISLTITYTINIKNALLDDRFYETKVFKDSKPNSLTIIENDEINGYTIVQSFEYGDSFESFIIKAKEGYILPSDISEQTEELTNEDKRYKNMEYTKGVGNSVIISCSEWDGSDSIVVNVEAIAPSTDHSVHDGAEFDTPVNQEWVISNSSFQQYDSEGQTYYGLSIQASKNLYLTEDIVIASGSSIGIEGFGLYEVSDITVNLCLNGHKITIYNISVSIGIYIYDATLNIYDPSGEGSIEMVYDSSISATDKVNISHTIEIRGGTFNLFGGKIVNDYSVVYVLTSERYEKIVTGYDEDMSEQYYYKYLASSFNMFGGTLYSKNESNALSLGLIYTYDSYINTAHEIKIYGGTIKGSIVNYRTGFEPNIDMYGYNGDTITISNLNGYEGLVLFKHFTADKVKFVNFTNATFKYMAVQDGDNVILKPAKSVDLSTNGNGSFSDGSESGLTNFYALEGKTLSEAGLTFVLDTGYVLEEYLYQAKITKIAAGDDFTVILLSDGTIWACGGNDYGQLGNKTYDGSNVFVQMQSQTGAMENVSMIYAKGHMVVAQMADGTIMACGDNTYGQLGINSNAENVNYFTQMVDSSENKLENVNYVYLSGNHTFVKVLDSEYPSYSMYYSSGLNTDGQLGLGTYNNVSAFNKVTEGISYIYTDGSEIKMGSDYTILINTDSYYFCGNPEFVKTMSGYLVNSMSTGLAYSISDLVMSVSEKCNTFTGLFDQMVDANTHIMFGEGFIISYTYTNTDTYYLRAFGDNSKGQCSLPSSVETYASEFADMYDVNGNLMSNVINVYVGKDFVVAEKMDGSIWVCGNNENGQLGLGSNQPIIYQFTQVASSLDNYIMVAIGGSHIVTLNSSGSIFAAGSNSSGQLGLDSSVNKLTEREVTETLVSVSELSSIVVNYNMNVRAVTKLQEYDITLDTNSGGVIANTTVESNNHKLVVNDLPIPEWDEYHTFVGWYTLATDGELVTDQELSADITIYARWTINYKVTLDAQGGTVTPAYLVTKDGKLVNLPNPVYDSSHLFFAWFTEEDGEGDEVNLDTVFTKDTTIYANYIEIPKGIEEIVKSTVDNVDTYTIKYTDGTEDTIVVTNCTCDGTGSGTNGETPFIGENGNWWIGTTDTEVKAAGEDGTDGKTPQLKIGDDNNWYVSYDDGTTWTNLNVKATGATGATGNGIEKIEVVKTEGLVVTYRITFTNEETFDFTVTNGSDGENGKKLEIQINEDTNEWEYRYEGDIIWTSTGVKATGSAGADGKTPQLKIGDDNNWYVSYDDGATWTNLNVKATGSDGITPKLRINSETYYWEVSYDSGSTWNSLGVKATSGSGSGVDGITPKLRINAETNEWEVSYDNGTSWTSLEVKATGSDGNDGTNGKNIIVRINSETNEWEYQYEGDLNWTSLGVKATGEAGRGIVSIEKTSTEGLVDTYTITYTDGTTSTFTVKNGQNGGEDGITPHIGENGNWFIGSTDTGVKAVGETGATGEAGADGKQIIVRINSETNEWEYQYEGDLNWTSLGVKATGEAGRGIVSIEKTSTEGLVDTYTITYTDGTTSTFTVKNGQNATDGENGITPHIGENGNWFIGSTDTGVKALGTNGQNGTDGKEIKIRINPETLYWEYQYEGDTAWISLSVKAVGEKGEKGDDGKGIVKIEKTNTEGLVDTYTITYTDGDTFEFYVTNGATVTKYVQPTVGENGNWFIGSIDTGVYAGTSPDADSQLRVNEETNEWEVTNDLGVTWQSLGVKVIEDPITQSSSSSVAVIIACVASFIAVVISTVIAIFAIRDKKRMEEIIKSLTKDDKTE